MLELEQLHYAPATSVDPILNGIQLRASAGRPVLIAGASGSGKTSLLEVISGLAACRTGTIRWQSDALTQRQRRSLCGIVFQFPERHFLGLTVQQELKLGHRRLPGERLEQVLQQVGLGSIDRSMAPERLSGGQQRRLSLAVQLLRGAQVLLLDEPTAGLDWSVRDDVLDLLADLSKERVLIVVTHEPELFRNWQCDRHRLQNGQLSPLTTLPRAES
ncbi:MAG: ABC transporter ATP-binding protein [Cyanobacteriota bacterium]|nr:ABC transporter ATP-binding protein [Cyanobacteriota bacterium]MED5383187.1 ABC transporter ATP-binding protein [Cyanobacteriota bacterium]